MGDLYSMYILESMYRSTTINLCFKNLISSDDAMNHFISLVGYLNALDKFGGDADLL